MTCELLINLPAKNEQVIDSQDAYNHNETAGSVKTTVLPEGYSGKILLVVIRGGDIDGQVCLRSGDLWHREILRNTQVEIRNLGYSDSSVYELGGAYVRFEPNNDIVIFGTSDDFGSCDKGYAAKLIQQEFIDRNVIILD